MPNIVKVFSVSRAFSAECAEKVAGMIGVAERVLNTMSRVETLVLVCAEK